MSAPPVKQNFNGVILMIDENLETCIGQRCFACCCNLLYATVEELNKIAK